MSAAEELHAEADPELRLGSLALRAGMITEEALHRALSTQAREAIGGKLPRQLGLILLADGVLNETQLDFLIRQQQTFRRGTKV
ncbi:MAG: hypothetical protein JO332_09085 [Planctomycetaceae bacterium]|nr:hypothetical protein [Planctomycetaceae bacterium]